MRCRLAEQACIASFELETVSLIVLNLEGDKELRVNGIIVRFKRVEWIKDDP